MLEGGHELPFGLVGHFCTPDRLAEDQGFIFFRRLRLVFEHLRFIFCLIYGFSNCFIYFSDTASGSELNGLKLVQFLIFQRYKFFFLLALAAIIFLRLGSLLRFGNVRPLVDLQF